MIKGFDDIYQDEKKELLRLESELSKCVENGGGGTLEDALQPIKILNSIEEHYLNLLKVLNVTLDMVNNTRSSFVGSIREAEVDDVEEE